MTTADVTVQLPLLTTSSAKVFRRCQREYQLRIEMGYSPVSDANSLQLGTLAHVGLEAWWKAGSPDERLPAALDAVRVRVAHQPVDPYDLARVEEMLIGYDARWGAEELVALAVEVEFRAPLLNPVTGAASKTWQRAGKCDAIVQSRDGRIWILEHKTAADDIEPGSMYWRRLQIDDQVSNYFVGARALGYDVAGCIYDVLGKPSIKPCALPLTDSDGAKIVIDADGNRVRTKDGKKWRETGDTAQGYELQTRAETPDEFRARLRDRIAEAPEKHYQRGEVVRFGTEEDEAAFDAWQIGRAIRDAQLAKRWPRNPDSCGRYGQVCSFFDVCCRIASLNDTSRFVQKGAHSELNLSLSPSPGESS